MRALQNGRVLKEIGDVSLIVVTSDPDEQARRETAAEFNLLNVAVVQKTSSTFSSKVRRAVDARYLDVHGCSVSSTDRQMILQEADRHDLVWIENARTPNIVGHWKWPRSHLDINDVPSTYLRSLSKTEGSAGKKVKYLLQAGMMRVREQSYTERFATLSVCSDRDRSLFRNDPRVHVIPNGLPLPPEAPERRLDPQMPRLGFIGLCRYEPNAHGIAWFLENCWPIIRRELPGVRLRLAGDGSESIPLPSGDDVDRLGWIEDPDPEIATWAAMVIPMWIGGGTRMKLADAFSRKCPVVATPIGAYGYDVQDGRELRLAATANAFADACVDLIRDSAGAEEMARRAYTAFAEQWSWKAIAPSVRQAAEDCLRRSQSVSAM